MISHHLLFRIFIELDVQEELEDPGKLSRCLQRMILLIFEGKTIKAGRIDSKFCELTFFFSIVQVLKQSGCEVPEYMLALKKRGKKHRKQLLVSAVKREDITTDFIAKKR